MVDPLEPPLPAKVTADQVLKFAESLARAESQKDCAHRSFGQSSRIGMSEKVLT